MIKGTFRKLVCPENKGRHRLSPRCICWRQPLRPGMGEDLYWRHQQWERIEVPQETNVKSWWRFNENHRKQWKKENKEHPLWDAVQGPWKQLHHTISRLHTAKRGHQENGVTSNRSRAARRVTKQWGNSHWFLTSWKGKYLGKDALLTASNTGWKQPHVRAGEANFSVNYTEINWSHRCDVLTRRISEEVSQKPWLQRALRTEKKKSS